MHWIDWIIVIVLVATVIGGFVQGFFRAVCSFVGLIAGLVLAAWNYDRAASYLQPSIHSEPAANILGFLAIALSIMAICTLIGVIFAKVFKLLGLGCLDRIAGGAFGFLQGSLLVTIFILVTLAFFPNALWLEQAELPHYFFGACTIGTMVTPQKLADQVHNSIGTLEQKSSHWLHTGPG